MIQTYSKEYVERLEAVYEAACLVHDSTGYDYKNDCIIPAHIDYMEQLENALAAVQTKRDIGKEILDGITEIRDHADDLKRTVVTADSEDTLNDRASEQYANPVDSSQADKVRWEHEQGLDGPEHDSAEQGQSESDE